MEHPKLSPHQFRSISKQLEAKERRAAGEALGKRGAQLPKRGRRRTDWDDEDETPYTFEKTNSRGARVTTTPDLTSLDTATVIEARGKDTVVEMNGETFVARLSSRLVLSGLDSPMVAGDQVRVSRLSDDLLRIDVIEPRRSVLSRFAGSGEDPIAANVDLVLLVCSPASPPFRPGLVDRYMVASALAGLTLAVCLNKTDLGVPDEVKEMLDGYASLGVDVIPTSIRTGAGIDALKAALAGRITLFTGHSGVGKSSLLNAIEPGLSLRTGLVTQATAGVGKGTHTTTSARLIPLSIEGAYVVDSPGVRAFGLGRLTPDEAIAGFPEIAQAAEDCQVRRCTHIGEPGCAVEAALAATPFGRHRLASYRSLLSAE